VGGLKRLGVDGIRGAVAGEGAFEEDLGRGRGPPSTFPRGWVFKWGGTGGLPRKTRKPRNPN